MAHKNKTMQGKDYRYKKPGTKVTLKPKEKGQKKVSFHAGMLHRHLGIPQGQKIPEKKKEQALKGKFGPKVEEEVRFEENVLTGRK